MSLFFKFFHEYVFLCADLRIISEKSLLSPGFWIYFWILTYWEETFIHLSFLWELKETDIWIWQAFPVCWFIGFLSFCWAEQWLCTCCPSLYLFLKIKHRLSFFKFSERNIIEYRFFIFHFFNFHKMKIGEAFFNFSFTNFENVEWT